MTYETKIRVLIELNEAIRNLDQTYMPDRVEAIKQAINEIQDNE